MNYTVAQQILAAIIMVESGGNQNPPDGTHGEVGILQITQGCIDDINRLAGTAFTKSDFRQSQELSIWGFMVYIGHYAAPSRLGRIPTAEDMARIWNGGPNGWKKSATVAYWNRVLTQARATT